MVLEILKELEIVSCTSSRKNSGGLRHHYSYLIGATTTFDKEPQHLTKSHIFVKNKGTYLRYVPL